MGICGLGGSGKTTIAKAVYNRYCSSFTRHSFLSDVREEAIRGMGLVALQKQLLNDIFKNNFGFSKEQVDALAGELNWFGEGSRVIITSRDEHILNMVKVDKDKIYRSRILDPMQSLRLFSLHAFSTDQPPVEYMELSSKVAQYSGGLPLTLEDVQRKLRLSYDNLDDDQKAIFLDAACFFSGWEKKAVMSIWKACDYDPEVAIDGLSKRSLIKFETHGGFRLRIHDQLRDMGKEIVRQENCMEPGMRSRLWRLDEISEVLEGCKCFQELKVLDLSECKSLSKSPNFLWFPNLERLDLRYCVSLVELDESIKHLSELKFLILKFCYSLEKLPEMIGDLKSLVKLDLTHTKMEELPDSICRLSSLKKLILQLNVSLKKLPENIGELKSLVNLKLTNVSSIEELPDGVGLLEKLEELDVEGCSKLEKLPRSMGRMRCLQKLNLKGTNVSKLPDDFSRLSNLEKLKMPSMLQTLPPDLSHLKNLKQLEFSYCEELQHIPELPSTLVVLCCVYCRKLVRLPDLSSFKFLKTLKLDYCEKLEEIRGLEGTESLEELLAPECYELTNTPRKILGQGTLLLPNSKLQGETYSLSTDDGIDAEHSRCHPRPALLDPPLRGPANLGRNPVFEDGYEEDNSSSDDDLLGRDDDRDPRNRHPRRQTNYRQDNAPFPVRNENYRIKADIPNFHGSVDIEGYYDWEYEVEQFFNLMDVAEDRQVKLVAYKLKGGAAAWWT
ncbi:disease resistance protein RUN1-like [Telopea speciosissima]|uniref:disease resistance protein RUN1-like n=1 Tax=Telopea speciosissima TaxID=54955 RepID=UPI001CC373AD|nr:disease resistance protein RUN1-like [Telopea speciosissima]